MPQRPWLRIRHPVHQARFLLDPTLPPEYSTIALQAETNQSLERVQWYHNDRLLARKAWPYTLRWSLRKGTHRFVAVGPRGTLRSRPIVIYVR